LTASAALCRGSTTQHLTPHPPSTGRRLTSGRPDVQQPSAEDRPACRSRAGDGPARGLRARAVGHGGLIGCLLPRAGRVIAKTRTLPPIARRRSTTALLRRCQAPSGAIAHRPSGTPDGVRWARRPFRSGHRPATDSAVSPNKISLACGLDGDDARRHRDDRRCAGAASPPTAVLERRMKGGRARGRSRPRRATERLRVRPRVRVRIRCVSNPFTRGPIVVVTFVGRLVSGNPRGCTRRFLRLRAASIVSCDAHGAKRECRDAVRSTR